MPWYPNFEKDPASATSVQNQPTPCDYGTQNYRTSGSLEPWSKHLSYSIAALKKDPSYCLYTPIKRSSDHGSLGGSLLWHQNPIVSSCAPRLLRCFSLLILGASMTGSFVPLSEALAAGFQLCLRCLFYSMVLCIMCRLLRAFIIVIIIEGTL